MAPKRSRCNSAKVVAVIVKPHAIIMSKCAL